MRKYSRQRQLILDYLKSTTSHPTAEQIYAELKPQNPALSLSTVYRNLRLLADDGIILRLDTGESTDRFDADLSEHHHFICTKCGQVTDVFRSFLKFFYSATPLSRSAQLLMYVNFFVRGFNSKPPNNPVPHQGQKG